MLGGGASVQGVVVAGCCGMVPEAGSFGTLAAAPCPPALLLAAYASLTHPATFFAPRPPPPPARSLLKEKRIKAGATMKQLSQRMREQRLQVGSRVRVHVWWWWWRDLTARSPARRRALPSLC